MELLKLIWDFISYAPKTVNETRRMRENNLIEKDKDNKHVIKIIVCIFVI